ncbi:uncharacterized protein Z518_10125 [Rhinocladiella mackenziei CBS 650.93]|uniref:MARVEL domain-containing protein n=1 Tax=Rhinocladiella mackenziei CBS 650.93 TaxID=1442369 RepID=A0A0D2I5K1_9EURO|nr:uncharacterized protein Z518_10125 [Rhinocladiella mackenziei CBS 650.93]KIX01059.1 hypothetical protein Z518_10125 [Rhinocladiella mackenziei CBS 650.93]
MVSRKVNLILRGLEFIFTLIVMALVGNIIATAFAGNPASINFDMFVVTFGMLSLFYLIAVAFNDSFAGHPIIPIALDLLNTIFYFCAAVNMAAQLGVHSCDNDTYTHSNEITNGSDDTEGRCREAQASTAFLWFAWACWTVSLFFTIVGARSSGANLRGGIGRRGAPAMSQV